MFGLVIDADCHALGGARREGTFVSSVLVFKSISSGIMSQVFLAGMGIAGIATENPDIVTTPCYHEEILDQKSSGVTYVLLMQALSLFRPSAFWPNAPCAPSFAAYTRAAKRTQRGCAARMCSAGGCAMRLRYRAKVNAAQIRDR